MDSGSSFCSCPSRCVRRTAAASPIATAARDVNSAPRSRGTRTVSKNREGSRCEFSTKLKSRPCADQPATGHDITLRQAIAAALPFVEKSFPGQPRLEAALRNTLSRTFLYTGDAAQAVEQSERARKLYVQLVGPDHPDTLQSMMDLANSYAALGRQAEALKLREETLEIRRRVLPKDHLDTLQSSWRRNGTTTRSTPRPWCTRFI